MSSLVTSRGLPPVQGSIKAFSAISSKLSGLTFNSFKVIGTFKVFSKSRTALTTSSTHCLSVLPVVVKPKLSAILRYLS